MSHSPMKPGARASLIVVALALVGSVLLLRSIQPVPNEPTAMIARSPSAQGPSSYTITLVNDSYYDAEFETFSLGDYTNTVRSLGTIDAQDSSEITLTVGAGRYVFALTGTSETYPAMMNSIVTEARLVELDYVFSFLLDNMSFAALDASELPSGFYDHPPTVILPDPTDTPGASGP